ncbi:MAG: hypothetical protein ABJ205_04320 [Erythrobacter sp.]|uniref:hypothetical protein n=1 Tax=Erythrobacter sp. TaxID=1042 RepID=UPI003262CF0C
MYNVAKTIADRRAEIKARTRKRMISGILQNECPSAIEAAGEAYLIWYAHHTEFDFKDLLLDFRMGAISPFTFYTKFANLCEVVISDCIVPEKLRDDLYYAWGYFEASKRQCSPLPQT